MKRWFRGTYYLLPVTANIVLSLLILSTLRIEAIGSSKMSVLTRATYQKTAFFIVTTVKTSNLTYLFLFQSLLHFSTPHVSTNMVIIKCWNCSRKLLCFCYCSCSLSACGSVYTLVYPIVSGHPSYYIMLRLLPSCKYSKLPSIIAVKKHNCYNQELWGIWGHLNCSHCYFPSEPNYTASSPLPIIRGQFRK
jgi:hypothetical protein